MEDVIKKVRKGFPALSQGIYANTAAAGPFHESLFNWRQERELDLLIGASSHFMSGLKDIETSRSKLAGFFNCNTSQIALVPSFSLGINLLLNMLPKRQRVLLVEEDYPSVNWPFERNDFDLRQVAIGQFLEEGICEKVRTENIDVLAISLVQWLSGAFLDLSFLKNLKNEFPDLIIVADGTQFCGMFPFEFPNSGIDVLLSSGYKWLLAGYGNGFMLFDTKFMEQHTPNSIGFGSVRGNKRAKDSIPFCHFFEPGHLDALAIGSLGVSIDFLEELGMDAIGNRNKRLSTTFKELLSDTDFLPDWVFHRKNHSTIFSIKGDAELYKKLLAKNVVCAQREGRIRLSFHFFNTAKEIEAIVEILKK